MDRFGLTPKDWARLTYRKSFPETSTERQKLLSSIGRSDGTINDVQLAKKWRTVWAEMFALESTRMQVLLLLQWAQEQSKRDQQGIDYLALANALLKRNPMAAQILATLSPLQRVQLILDTPYHYTLQALWKSYLPFILQFIEDDYFTEEMLDLVNVLLQKRAITCRELESWLETQPGHPLPHCTRHLALDERVGPDVADLISSFVSE